MDTIGKTSAQISQNIVATGFKYSGDSNMENLEANKQLQIYYDPSGGLDIPDLRRRLKKTQYQEENNLLNINHPLQVPSECHSRSESTEDIPGLEEVKDLFDISSESDDDIGCPLPSTPEDENALVTEIAEVLKAGVLNDEIDLTSLTRNPTLETEKFVLKVCDPSWHLCHYSNLPDWMQDNDFLISGYRPPLPSFYACFKSIFRLHTETANIWTHLLGCIAFIALATYFLAGTSNVLHFGEKMVFGVFFMGVIVCLGLSSAYHTLHCHSECIGRLFSKLDYCGIALLIMGSFVPWLYYGFYCQFHLTMIYLTIVICLGITSIVVSLWDKFSEPRYRPLRAGLFLAFGLSGIVPAVHYAVAEGWINAVSQASLHWLLLMGCLYILGALFYALRVPERFFPGMCDIWFQSHQIFHVLVIAAAFVHFHGISEMAINRMTMINDYDCSNR